MGAVGARALEAVRIRTQIKLLAVIAERERKTAAACATSGLPCQAQQHQDFASLCAMFAQELAVQNRAVLVNGTGTASPLSALPPRAAGRAGPSL